MRDALGGLHAFGQQRDQRQAHPVLARIDAVGVARQKLPGSTVTPVRP